jgi:glycosyltransferase involved in cell wall biosynthesis
VDGWSLGGTPEGVRRYVASLLAEASVTPGPFSWTAAYPAPFLPERPIAAGRVDYLPIPFPGPVARHRVWEQFLLPGARLARPGALFLSPSYTLPLLMPRPRVVMVHDISYEIEPTWFSPREAFFLRRLTRRAVARADLVLACSTVTRNDLQERYGLPDDRCPILFPGIDRCFSPGDREESRRIVARELGLAPPYLLTVGAILNRRNLPTLVNAAASVMRNRPGLSMAICGVNRTSPRLDLPALFASTGMADRFRRLEGVSEGLLVHLYRGASAFVTLSLYEGFGFPAAEAMACGTPVVAARRGSLPEVVGSGGVLVDPTGPGETAAALAGILDAGDPPAEETARIAAAVAGFTWDKTLTRLEGLLGELP